MKKNLMVAYGVLGVGGILAVALSGGRRKSAAKQSGLNQEDERRVLVAAEDVKRASDMIDDIVKEPIPSNEEAKQGFAAQLEAAIKILDQANIQLRDEDVMKAREGAVLIDKTASLISQAIALKVALEGDIDDIDWAHWIDQAVEIVKAGVEVYVGIKTLAGLK